MIGWQPGLKIYKDVSNSLREKCNTTLDPNQVRNRTQSMDKLYGLAREILDATGVSDTEHRTLKDRIKSKCWFFYDVDDVWSEDMSNEPIIVQCTGPCKERLRVIDDTFDDDVQSEVIDVNVDSLEPGDDMSVVYCEDTQQLDQQRGE
ncbi:hypothetical protein BG011_001557 [Mortierella polycephala]|uniref:Uncharacterized protein n=1 Tax=Mortierella polycephala TaxID=41804 RepID=A0A9P6TU16_9FUNG|nr:hypothetical protein BG011_001557 [Mortierella polycephala]